MRLSGKVAVVTGASRGVGRAVALALAREGCSVVVAAKTESPDPRLPGTILDTARDIEALGARALPVKADVRKEEDVERLAQRTFEAFGRADVLVNNAGALFWGGLADTPPRRFDLVMDVNVRGAFLCTRAFLPALGRQGGHVLMMSPPVGTRRLPGRAPYLISKMGMTMLALALAEEARAQRICACALWPAALLESQATRHFGLGSFAQWRKPDILADAVVAVAASPFERYTGRALYDEDVLREEGVTDFSHYACVPGALTPPLCREMVE
jgi:citronellol/citronellal dehydrogenase